MSNLFSVGTIAFTILGYPMSYIEFVGTLLYLGSVWLVVQRNILTWPIGIASVILYAILFYQIRLYADVLEQVYFLIASIYGWINWRNTPVKQETLADVRYSTRREMVLHLAFTLAVGGLFGLFLMQAHRLVPVVFPEKASFPVLDALTTVMSFTAMWLLARKRVENWYYWIIVDGIGIGLYAVKGVIFVALLYVVLFGMALRGALSWHRASSTAK